MKDFNEWFERTCHDVASKHTKACMETAWHAAKDESQDRATVASNNQVRAQYEAAGVMYFECGRCGRIKPGQGDDPVAQCPTCPK